MIIIRTISWVLVAIAIAVLGADGISTVENGEPVIRTLQEILALMNVNIANIDPEASMSGLGNFFLDLPFWVLVGLPGIILTLMFRPMD